MEIRQFRKSDIKFLNMTDCFKKLFRKSVSEEYSFTVLEDNEIMFCIGGTPLWDGVMESWISIVNASNPMRIVLTARRLMLDSMVKFRIHRLQGIVRADNTQAQRLMAMLGFKDKFKMEKFNADKTDSYMYSLVI
ncbi:hypothetical protein LCGC14_0866280 [marine sediment metagenome]|uniref:N-acetyltransferase domain-containing protein n=1 Tax=marine sediment metagenome TaxID=412755 RepID=A0A0F9PB10_9ZZZZ